MLNIMICNMIKILASNQHKIKTIVSNQVSLLERSIKSVNESIAKLSHNQITIKSRLLQIEQFVRENEIKNLENFGVIIIEMVISQITTEYLMINEILENLEDAISFSKLNVLHNSIVKPEELLSKLKQIRLYLQKGTKLPFEPNIENILLFEKTASVKSYSKFNCLTFIIEIALVEEENYEYFQLLPLPIKNNSQYQIILPTNNFLFINEHKYSLHNKICQEIQENEFLCKENVQDIQENSPCEVQLLQYKREITTCKILSISLNKVKIQKLSDNQFLLILMNKTIINQECNQLKEKFSLEGTYIVELINQCQLKIGNINLRTYQNSKLKFKQLSLPALEATIPEEHKVKKPTTLNLDAVSLEEITSIGNALSAQEEEVQEIPDLKIIHYFNYWSILVYLILLIILIFCLIKYFKFKRQKKEERKKKKDQPDEIQI